MDIKEIIQTRRSVRTFNDQPLTKEDREKLETYVKEINNPFQLPMDFYFLDTEVYDLSTPVIKGEYLYVTAKIKEDAMSEVAFGYAFEKLVLYAWSMGIGTTWIGGTMDRQLFEKAVDVQPGEHMYCVSPLGYPAEKMSIKETMMRKGVQADKRKKMEEIFFENDLDTPLQTEDAKLLEAMELVRLAPSATNTQPWRIVKIDDTFHFYVKHKKGYASRESGDMQKIDIGIAVCHFLEGIEGEVIINDPKLTVPEDTEYLVSVKI